MTRTRLHLANVEWVLERPGPTDTFDPSDATAASVSLKLVTSTVAVVPAVTSTLTGLPSWKLKHRPSLGE